MKPPKNSTKEDRNELHREKMRNKAARRVKWNKERNALKPLNKVTQRLFDTQTIKSGA